MPISVKELHKRQRPLEDQISEHLAQNADKAYTFNELIATIEGYSNDAWLALTIALDATLQSRYGAALARLAAKGTIQTAQIRGSTYYAIKR